MAKNIRFVGIDIGSHTTYVAGVFDSSPVIVLGESGKRFTPTCVSFRRNKCFIGALAEQKRILNLENTVTTFPRLLGKRGNDDIVIAEKAFIYYEIDDTNDKLFIKLSKNGETKYVLAETLLALQIKNTLTVSKIVISDTRGHIVFNVPTYFTQRERVAALNSIELADIPREKIRLINDTTAIGFMYGSYRTKKDVKLDNASKVAFVSVGHSNLQIAIIEYHGAGMRVLSTACDPCLGSRDFDRCLYEYFEPRFKNVLTTNKAKARLLQTCAQLNKLLGQATPDMSVNMQCVLGDVEISLNIKRRRFENLESVKKLVKKIKDTLSKTFEGIDLTKEGISVIELVGGGGYIPAVKNCVEVFFGKKPSTTLNGNEVIACGCSLLSAFFDGVTNASRSYKIRDKYHHTIKITDNLKNVLKLKPLKMSAKDDFDRPKDFWFNSMKTFSRKDFKGENITVEYDESTCGHINDRLLGRCEKINGSILPYIDDNGLFLLKLCSKSESYTKFSFENNFGLEKSEKDNATKFLEQVKKQMDEEQKIQMISNSLEQWKFRLEKCLRMSCIMHKDEKWKESVTKTIEQLNERIFDIASGQATSKHDELIKDCEIKFTFTLKAAELVNKIYHEPYEAEENVIKLIILKAWWGIEDEELAKLFVELFNEMEMTIKNLFTCGDQSRLIIEVNAMYGFSLEEIRKWLNMFPEVTGIQFMENILESFICQISNTKCQSKEQTKKSIKQIVKYCWKYPQLTFEYVLKIYNEQLKNLSKRK